ncbi:MAG: hypothetical protein WDN23_11815 [Edaphobacter sp.]
MDDPARVHEPSRRSSAQILYVPSPKDVLGYYIGAPKKLTYYADVVRYYRTLAEKSPRVKVIDIGKTEEGRESIMVFVGSEDSIKISTPIRKIWLASPIHEA